MNRRHTRLSLSLASLCLAGATILARLDPSAGYELSIYAATPLPTWVGLIGTICFAIPALFFSSQKSERLAAGVVVCLAIVVVTGLPIIRGYEYLGQFDSLHHLGSVKDILRGNVIFRLLIYPGIHLLAAFLTLIGVGPPTDTLMLLLPIFALAYLLGLWSLVRRLSRPSGPFGLLFAALLLPIISVRMPILQPVPTTLALLFLPMGLFSLTLFLDIEEQINPAATAILNFIFTTSLLLYHPQHGLVLVFLAFALGIVRYFDNGGRWQSANAARLFPQVALGSIAAYILLGNKPPFVGAILGLVGSLLTRSPSAPSISNRGSSLQNVGGSLLEVFLKAFSAHVVILSFAVVAFLWFLWSRRSTGSNAQNTMVIGLGLTAVPITAASALYLATGGLGQFLRYGAVGFIFATIIAALGVGGFVRRSTYDNNKSHVAMSSIIMICMCILLTISMLTVYQSPYIYKSGSNVQGSQLAGYESSFETRAEGVDFMSVVSAIEPYRAGIYGFRATVGGNRLPRTETLVDPLNISRNQGGGIPYSRTPYHFGNESLSTYINDPSYLTVTAFDRAQSAQLYEGLRYSYSDFQSLEADPAISKIRTTGGFTLYYIEEANSSSNMSQR